ncbi:EID1-like F-box protein 3 [Salvia splendens]|uniref:EID1-like F-box protein 3 n=1 Tax=Salvia splendens TaxID=180675 RepID=UPI001C26E56B|nr:EID1-like F-box protein 3 [Salvia splendens]
MGEWGSSSQVMRLSESANSGLVNERVLFLVFEHVKWDIRTLCCVAAVSWKLRALAKRLLWRELCISRAPRMIAALTEGATNSRIIGGWPALAKLLFFCGGCDFESASAAVRQFRLGRPLRGHFTGESRFSKTSGRSFLARSCRGDVLYVSDPCEHAEGGGNDVVGIYRGVFRSFFKSRTRERLIARQIGFEEGVRCPYCAARVWSMTAARLIPQRTAARKLGSSGDGAVEYFVCLNGHLHGLCWLVHLSSDDGGDEEEDDDGSFCSGDEDGGDRNCINSANNGNN